MGASCKALLDYNVQTSKKKGAARYTREPHPTIKALKEVRQVINGFERLNDCLNCGKIGPKELMLILEFHTTCGTRRLLK